MNKTQLEAYWVALCNELEREVFESPETKKAMKADIKKLEQSLSEWPDRIARAKEIGKKAK